MNKSWIAAGVVALATVGWFASGLQSDEPAPAPPARMAAGAGDAFLVEIAESTAQPVEQVLTLLGATRPLRSVTLRPRITSTVVEINAREGERVEAGAPIVRLDVEDRAALHLRAEASYEQAVADHESAESLRTRGAVSATELRQRYTAMQTASADLEAARIAMDGTVIAAPFAGVFERRSVELGDRVSPEMADGVGQVIDISTLIVVVDVPQQSIGRLRPGQRALVTLMTGDQVEGRISFVAASADPPTRSFRTEIEIANPDQRLPAGMSAKVLIPTETVQAHFLSPALLVLDDVGRLGVKVVDAEGVVDFVAAEIVRGGADGVWVAGLPDSARIITVGQGFVRPGETVRTASAPMPEAVAEMVPAPASTPVSGGALAAE